MVAGRGFSRGNISRIRLFAYIMKNKQVIPQRDMSPCQFDWRADATLFCSVHDHFVITIVSGREANLRRLLALGLLAKEGQAWWDAMNLMEEN